MRIFRIQVVLLSFIFVSTHISCQSVVVSSYFNAADPRDEWLELLVVADNTDMRNWTLRDNNSSQTSWQTAMSFNTIAFWNNMRAGTIIIIWNRPVTSGSVAHPLDANKDDGYIELYATNVTYFGGGSFGTAPAWGGNSLNYAGGADVLQLRNSSGTHIHALGHNSSPGADWTALPSPKLNHNNSANSGDAIYICPGNVIADFGTNAPQAGTTWTSKNNVTITFGLPNISGGNPVTNTAFWDTIREPDFANQVVAPSSVVAGNPGSISFSWTGATDPNVADGTTGYFILRNTSNTFTSPSDGTTYTTGAALGSATIIAQIFSSSTTTYTDNTVMNGNAYYYRVYAFRYTTDNPNGNTYHRSRGRAYTSSFVDVQQTNPLPVQLTAFSGQQENQNVNLLWTTSSETNNDYFSVERSVDGATFMEIGIISGHGTSTQENRYAFTDYFPAQENNYYRLRQIDFNGMFEYSGLVVINFTEETTQHTIRTWNVENGIGYALSGWPGVVAIEVFDLNGNLVAPVRSNENGQGIISLSENAAGIYFLRFSCKDIQEIKKVAR
ncbi:MAG: T9SS type A sorting domain-containing protein [Bacteroidota bacterium]|nr:T9SS type A sorting domain-containing protein [Bacteroidota bacterium]